jgi:hypothetical protein
MTVTKNKILEISYADITEHNDVSKLEVASKVPCVFKCIGYFLYENNNWITVTRFFDRDEDQHEIVVIPKGCILSMRELVGKDKLSKSNE